MDETKTYLSDRHDFIKSKLVADKINEVIAPMGSGKTTLIKSITSDSYYTKTYDRLIICSPFSVSRVDYESVSQYQKDITLSPSTSRLFTYYNDLFKSFIKFLTNTVKTIDKSCVSSEQAFKNIIKLSAKLYAKSMAKTLFIFDEYDFAFTQLSSAGVLSKTFVLGNSTNQEDFNFELSSNVDTSDSNTIINYTVVFELFLSGLLESDCGIITFSANYSNLKGSSLTNLIEVNNVDSPIKYNSFNISYTTKRRTDYFSDLIKKTVSKATNSKSKTLIFVPYIHLYTLKGLLDGLNKDRNTLLLYRDCNINDLARPLLKENFTETISVLWPKQKMTFVDIDAEVPKIEKTYRVLDYYTDGVSGLFVHYDTIIVGVSHTRQASLFFNEDQSANRPNVIAISKSDKPFLSASALQATGRFRTGRPDVTILFKINQRKNSEGKVEPYYLNESLDHIIKSIDPNLDKYRNKDTKMLFIDHTNGQKGQYKGKSISEKTASMDKIKGNLCKSIYLMLDAGKTVREIISSHTGKNQVDGLTENQTVRLVYECDTGKTSKKFSRERLGL